ncbi:MAG: sigma-70 family RNA polymerase sigma factor [Clostridia bacterium]|nr:sigma-70 family RNA polymerase sigma factor [Clostridia bacterium]
MLLFLSLIETDEDRDFCEALYYRYRSAMLYRALFFLKNQYDAEDIVQTVFCETAAKYIEKLKGLKEDSRERFLLLVTKYRALNLLRERSKIVSLNAFAAEPGSFFDEPADHDILETICKKAEYEALNAAVEKLDPEEKAALWMRYKLELSPAETAEILGEKHQTIIKRVQRAKKKLASILDPEGGAA